MSWWRHLVRLSAISLGLPVLGCLGDAEDLRIRPDLATPTLLEGAPVDGEALPLDAFGLEGQALALGVLEGQVAVGLDGALWMGDATGQADLVEVTPLSEGDAPPPDTGAIRQLVRHGADELLVLAEGGLFQTRAGWLLRSPLTDALDVPTVKGLTVHEAVEAGLELWLWREGGGVQRWRDTALQDVQVQGLAQAPDALVALEPGRALWWEAGALYLLDLEAGEATLVLDRQGPLRGVAKGPDGRVHFALEAGLLTRTADGAFERRTFAVPGAVAANVLGVAAGSDEVVVALDGALVRLESGGGSTRLAALEAPSQALVLDAAQDTWLLQDGALRRARSGRPLSFATDVKPFFSQHCVSCHAGGAGGAPVRDLTSFDYVSENAALIVRRLEADGAAPMPPLDRGVLTPDDYAVVKRWIRGGMKP